MRRVLLCSVAALLGGLVYVNALHNPFVYDDYHTVVENPSLLNLADVRTIALYAITRPAINFSYAVDRAIWGAGPFGFHLTSVLLHVLNVVLLFQLARRLMDDVPAFAAAVFFAVHPMMTEAVGYISGRSEVLCATFFFMALTCGHRWLRGGGLTWGLLTVAVWGAALASKEIAAMFPFVLFCYDRLLLKEGASSDDRRRRLLTVHLPLVAAAVLAGIVRIAVFARVEYPGQSGIHWSYLLLDLDVARRYVWMLLVPSGQAIFHEVLPIGGLFDARLLLDVAVLGAMLALAWRMRRTEGTVSFGILWFLLLLVPSSVLIVLDQGELMAEHRIYLASCGLFLAGGAAIGWLSPRLAAHAPRRTQLLAGVALGITLLAFGSQTVVRNIVWADPIALWRESVDLAPDHYRPRLLLGEVLQDAGRIDEALEQFQVAHRMRPTEPLTHMKLGLALAAIGRRDEAAIIFKRLQALDPRNLPALRALVMLAEMEPINSVEALRLCEEIQQIAPGTPGNDECIRRHRARAAAGQPR